MCYSKKHLVEDDLVVKYLDDSGEIIDAEAVVAKVSPLKGVGLSQKIKAVGDASSVALHLYDKNS